MNKTTIKELSGIVKAKFGIFLIDIQDIGKYYTLTVYDGFDGKEIFLMEYKTAIDLKNGIYRFFKDLGVNFIDIIETDKGLLEKIVFFTLEEIEKEKNKYKALLKKDI